MLLKASTNRAEDRSKRRRVGLGGLHPPDDHSANVQRLRRPACELFALLVDLNLPNMSGVDLIRELHAQRPDYPCWVVSAFWEPSVVAGALSAGAGGFVGKGRPDQLVSVLQQVLAGEKEVVAVGDG